VRGFVALGPVLGLALGLALVLAQGLGLVVSTLAGRHGCRDPV